MSFDIMAWRPPKSNITPDEDMYVMADIYAAAHEHRMTTPFRELLSRHVQETFKPYFLKWTEAVHEQRWTQYTFNQLVDKDKILCKHMCAAFSAAMRGPTM